MAWGSRFIVGVRISSSQYGTKYVPVTVRDSTYVLDELCNNETELPIREHTTDTPGATEIILRCLTSWGIAHPAPPRSE